MRTFVFGTPLSLVQKKCLHWITPLTADVFYGQPLIVRMAVRDKNSLEGKENLPEYDFTVSQKKRYFQKKRYSQNIFPKIAEVVSSQKKKKLQPIFKNDSSIV